jgi:ribonucleotide reductase beta subunit family protein with ferritin-like domain
MSNKLLDPSNERFCMFPLTDEKIWNFYKNMLSCFWVVDEIDFTGDLTDFEEKLNDNERHFVKMILAFFASSDGIVNENLCFRFSNEVQLSEARAVYSVQNFIESIHSENYSLLIQTYIKDKDERNKLFNAINEYPCIKKKCDWGLKWIEDKESTFAMRLVAFAIMEGLFFSGAFCAIYWLKKRGLMKGLTFSNELISRDEGMHTDYAVYLYTTYCEKINQEEIYKLFKEAVNIEIEFINESLPCRLIGMNSDMMKQYIQFIADRLLKQLKYEPIYNVKNPFDFMELISLPGKTNFFEKRVSEYSLANGGDRSKAFEFNEDTCF